MYYSLADITMTLEDYIRQQEKKAGSAAKGAEIEETKSESRNAADDGVE